MSHIYIFPHLRDVMETNPSLTLPTGIDTVQLKSEEERLQQKYLEKYSLSVESVLQDYSALDDKVSSDNLISDVGYLTIACLLLLPRDGHML